MRSDFHLEHSDLKGQRSDTIHRSSGFITLQMNKHSVYNVNIAIIFF